MQGHTPQQLERIRRVIETAERIAPTLWDMKGRDYRWDRRARWYPEYEPETRESQRGEQLIAALADALGSDAHEAPVDVLVAPAVDRPADGPKHFVRLALEHALQAWAPKHLNAYAVQRLIERMRYMLVHPLEGVENPPLDKEWERNHSSAQAYLCSDLDRGYFRPQLRECSAWLADISPTPELIDFAAELFEGRFNVSIRVTDVATSSIQEYSSYEHCSSRAYRFIMVARDWVVLQRPTDYLWFCRAADLLDSSFVPYGLLREREYSRDYDAPEKLRDYTLRLAQELIEELPASADRMKRLFSVSYHDTGYVTHSLCWLRMGLESYERLRLTPAAFIAGDNDALCCVLRFLVNLGELAAAESQEDLRKMLQAFPEETLLAVLPFAGIARDPILQALGWNDVLGLQRRLFELAGGHPATTRPGDLGGLENSDDPEAGQIDRESIAAALEACEPMHLKAYLEVMRASQLNLRSALLCIEAVRGTNRKAIEKSLKQSGQVALKAYGLLPIQNEDDLLQRYLTLRRLFKEATRFGSERQANTQAAALAGLSNLAQTAGFADATRLEWKMERRVAEDAEQLSAGMAIGEWLASLQLNGDSPAILVTKGGKALKSVPPAVRKSPEYATLKERQAVLKDQVRRFRRTFEDIMCRGELLPIDDVRMLMRLPAAQMILAALVLRSSDGAFGLIDAQAEQLVDHDGKRHALGTGLRVAHGHDLYQSGVLHHWQHLVVQRRLVQPFKQAFRELYVLTPAERETATYSNRFAGHAVKGSVAARLLQARGWKLESGDEVSVTKRFRDCGLEAWFIFPDARYFLGANEEAVTDQIVFARDHKRIALTDVPPLVLSETMRDADLVVSVAQIAADHEIWSAETFERRRDLLIALAEDLKLKSVRCEGHFLHINGKLANYRMHIGSGAIHIEPGSYLCIVPAGAGPENFYLPYADTDRKTSEVVSKMLLLVNDHKIKDASILAQITRGAGAQAANA